MGWLDDLFGNSETTSSQTTTADWRQAPEYKEAEQARQTWGSTLEDWRNQPGYGAIQPDWANIWESARQKVSDYYSGSPTTGPGARARLAASATRRGMGDQDAFDRLMNVNYLQEIKDYKDIAIQQAIQKAAFGEQGRNTWMNSLMQLAGMKPHMLNYGGTTTGTQSTGGGEGWDLLGTGIGAAVGMYGMGQQNQMLDKWLDQSKNSSGGYNYGLSGIGMADTSNMIPYLSMMGFGG